MDIGEVNSSLSIDMECALFFLYLRHNLNSLRDMDNDEKLKIEERIVLMYMIWG